MSLSFSPCRLRHSVPCSRVDALRGRRRTGRGSRRMSPGCVRPVRGPCCPRGSSLRTLAPVPRPGVLAGLHAVLVGRGHRVQPTPGVGGAGQGLSITLLMTETQAQEVPGHVRTSAGQWAVGRWTHHQGRGQQRRQLYQPHRKWLLLRARQEEDSHIESKGRASHRAVGHECTEGNHKGLWWVKLWPPKRVSAS